MSKKNLILGGILVFLVIVAYIYQGPMKKWKENKGAKDNFFAEIDVELIDKIGINKNGEDVVLELIGDQWKVFGTKDFYAKQVFVDNIINSIEKAQESKFELVSSNKDKKQEFATGDEGVILRLFSGEEKIIEFIVGKMGVNYTSTYISQSDISKTYSVESGLSSAVNIEDFKDNTIFVSSKDNVSKIRFQYPNREFTVEKNKEGIWEGTLPYSFEVGESKLDKVLDIMSNLTAIEIPEQNFAETDLDKGLIIVQATGDNIDNTIMIGAEIDGNYYAKRGDSDNIYLITKEQRDELDKNISDFK